MSSEILIGALEAGGTKMICAIGDINGNIIKQQEFPTKTPQETVPLMLEFFKSLPIKALGIGSFGPIDVREKSPKYGTLISHIKDNWEDFSYIDAFKELNIPIKIDTDVNAACIGEMTYGTAKNLTNVIYITVGTGIGIGVCAEGNLIHGLLHPEGGHVLITKRQDDQGQCVCPYHNNCLEGLATGPSLMKRYNLSKEQIQDIEQMKDKTDIWDLEADYIAQGILSYVYVCCPEKIILGGGVMKQTQLFPLIRKKFLEKNNKYVNIKAFEDMDNYIVPASLNGQQGILGSLKLGIDILNKK